MIKVSLNSFFWLILGNKIGLKFGRNLEEFLMAEISLQDSKQVLPSIEFLLSILKQNMKLEHFLVTIKSLMEFFLNGAELSVNSVNSGYLINHWSMNLGSI